MLAQHACPRQGHVYTCYTAKKMDRAACKQAMNCNINRVTHQPNSMYRGRDLEKFWNLIHSTKRHKSSHNDITISTFERFFRDKFKQLIIKSDVILTAELDVQIKLDNCRNADFNDKVMSKYMVIKYIKNNNIGSSPGSDGI